VLFVPPPDEAARRDILQIFCKDKPVDQLDFDFLAKKSDNFSGADLKAVIDIAIEDKIRAALQRGSQQGSPVPLTTKDLLNAIKNVRPSTREWFSTARNYAIYSNEAGAYDDVIKYLKIK
jgi:SpoVK/Ycf46/Vps4 family AAA+-type ATPase